MDSLGTQGKQKEPNVFVLYSAYKRPHKESNVGNGNVQVVRMEWK
jgi:hypothetical protein